MQKTLANLHISEKKRTESRYKWQALCVKHRVLLHFVNYPSLNSRDSAQHYVDFFFFLAQRTKIIIIILIYTHTGGIWMQKKTLMTCVR